MVYHVNRNGLAVKCNNGGENCSFGSLSAHFDNIEDANEYASLLMKSEFSFIPNVQFDNSIIPSEDVISVLTQMYSELYVAAKYVLDNNIEPVICLGKNSDDESVYHCVYKYEDLFYDISGVVAYGESELEEYIKYNYDIVDYWNYVMPEKSIEMIGLLMGIDIRGEDGNKIFNRYLIKELSDAKHNGYSQKALAIEFILRELK